MQALLRSPRLAHDGGGLPLSPAGERRADSGAVPIMPRGLDEDAAGMRVPRFGQRPATLGVPRGVLAGHQAEIGHEFTWPAEPLEVDDLSEENHRGERVDAAEAPEPAYWLTVELGRGKRFNLLVQLRLPRQGLLEREQRGWNARCNGGRSKCWLRTQVQWPRLQFLPPR